MRVIAICVCVCLCVYVCVCVCMCVFFSNEASNNLCNVLEAVFLHGVKDNVVTKVLVSFIVINYLM